MTPASERHAIDGSFKTPTLRNVALTAPYFHNGGYSTLESVVRFYGRGGNRRGPSGVDDELDLDDTSGTGLLGNGDPLANQGTGTNVAAEIEEIDAEEADMAEGLPDAPQVGFTDQEVADLVAFMKSLTDPRVACRSGDFDHPQLVIAHGHVDDPSKNSGNATDYWDAILPATGREGGPCFQNTGDLFAR
jgi:cytochrome c peroxidase